MRELTPRAEDGLVWVLVGRVAHLWATSCARGVQNIRQIVGCRLKSTSAGRRLIRRLQPNFDVGQQPHAHAAPQLLRDQNARRLRLHQASCSLCLPHHLVCSPARAVRSDGDVRAAALERAKDGAEHLERTVKDHHHEPAMRREHAGRAHLRRDCVRAGIELAVCDRAAFVLLTLCSDESSSGVRASFGGLLQELVECAFWVRCPRSVDVNDHTPLRRG
eukprot:4861071-Prymnesium_polylepis.1